MQLWRDADKGLRLGESREEMPLPSFNLLFVLLNVFKQKIAGEEEEVMKLTVVSLPGHKAGKRMIRSSGK